MALSVSSIKAIVKAKREANLGVPDDAAKADKVYQAEAEALFEILTVAAATVLTSGLDDGGDTLVSLVGKII